MNVTYRKSKSRPEISRKSRQDLFSWSFCLESGRDPHVCGNVHGKVEIPQSTRTRTRTRTRASSGGEGRHGERRGGAKRDARGLKTRRRPQMMVMMARVAFRALKTKNGAAIAVRDGGARHRANESNLAGVRARIDGLRFSSATRGTFDSSVVTPTAIERAPQPSG